MLIEKFQQHAARTPDQPAVVVVQQTTPSGNILTYGQLNQWSDTIAHIVSANLPDTAETCHETCHETYHETYQETYQAALWLDKGTGLIAALVAVLKAGAAFVPLDPTYPHPRLIYMLEHSQSRLIITQQKYRAPVETVIAQTDGDITVIILEDVPNLPAPAPVRPKPDAGRRAYILYTSGSTGKPKGVMQTHGNVSYYVRNWIRLFNITAQDRMTLLTNFTHDGAMQDIFAALTAGAALYPYDFKNTTQRSEAADFCADNQITIWHSVPTLFRYFLDSLNQLEGYTFPHLRSIILGGEPLREHDVQQCRLRFPFAVPANVYGQTESSVSTVHLIKSKTIFKKIILGAPLDETQILLVDEEDEIVDDIATGEIVVCSNYIAPGYWRDPGKSKFTHDPELGPMYWTGDLGAYLGSGEIEILGRKDFQVKIRGFRVETGEVESSLLTLPGVAETIVKALTDDAGDTFLCAYIVLTPGTNASESIFQDHLSARLPDYMVPARYLFLDQLPLTGTGKIDRAALPDPRQTGPVHPYIEPRTDTEKKLARIWQDILYGSQNSAAPEHRPIGRVDHFFQSGGHSLRAMTVISQVHKEFNVKLELAEIFNYPHLKDLAARINQSANTSFQSLQAVGEMPFYPLSSAQERMFILHRTGIIGTAYNITLMLALEGKINVAQVEKIFVQLIHRHAVFRTRFFMHQSEPGGESRPVQAIQAIENMHINIPLHSAQTAAQLHRLGVDFIRPFQLDNPPLLRVQLVETSVERHVLMTDMHHIISDGTSMMILMQEFAALYTGEISAAPAYRYVDYAVWQKSPQQQAALNQQETYWTTIFKGRIPVLDLPLDFSRPAVRDFSGDRVYFTLTQPESLSINQLAATQGLTLYMLLLGIYIIQLSRLSNQADIVVGTPTAGRRHADLQNIVGMFVNTLALRTFPHPDKKINTFLTQLKESTLSAFENQDYPFEDLVEKVNVARDTSRNPIFDTLFTLQNFDAQASGIQSVQTTGLTVAPHNHEIRRARFDLTLTAGETQDGLSFVLEYSTRLFSRQSIEQTAQQYLQALRSILTNQNRTLRQVELISPAQQQQLLETINHPDTPYPANTPLHQLFAHQAQRTPYRIALIAPPFHPAHTTYQALNQQVRHLAQALKQTGLLPGDIVALELDRTQHMITAMLAVLTIGAAYLPIDPDYPEERKQYILKDSNAKRHLTTQIIQQHIQQHIPQTAPTPQTLQTSETTPPHAPCYIIYTSGTTGRPKGAVLTHANVSRLVLQTNYIHITPNDRILQLSNYVFDVSVFDIYGALLNGAALIMTPKTELTAPDQLAHRIQRHAVSLFFAPTALFNILVEHNLDALQHVRKIGAAGEPMSVQHARKVTRRFGPGRLLNGYGPTETAVFATVHPVDDVAEHTASIPIGTAITGTQVHLLDPWGKPVPIGMRGEIYISGPAVGPGYLNQPELTAQRFLPAPQAHRAYKTGDLGRRLPDGSIQFLGRTDQQIKLRGYRIEPGEIEHSLLRLDTIREAAVQLRHKTDGDAYLCAYIVPTDPEHLEDPQPLCRSIRLHLQHSLPDYMIPAFLELLPRMPRNAAGKLDSRNLPEPSILTVADTTLQLPRTQTETELQNIWSRLLSLEPGKIGIQSHFFRLGGHSLKATAMVDTIHKHLSVKINPIEIFQNPTIAALADLIDARTRNGDNHPSGTFASIPVLPSREHYPLSFAQKRLWVIQQLNPGSTIFNMPAIMPITQGANRDIIEAVFKPIIARHDCFRTYFREEDDDVVMKIQDPSEASCRLMVEDLRDRDPAPQDHRIAALTANEAGRVFNLMEPPLYRLTLIRCGEDSGLLLFNIHHIVFDGWSQELLQQEFQQLHQRLLENKDIHQDPLRIQYRDYAHWHNQHLKDGLTQASAFWREQLSGHLPTLNLPYDHEPGTKPANRHSAAFRAALSEEISTTLEKLAQHHEASLFMVLLAGFNLLLANICAQEKIIIGIPGAARRHEDLKNLMGLFVNTLIISTTVSGAEPFAAFLQTLRDNTMSVLEYQTYPLELICEQLNIPYPQLTVFFNKTDIIGTKAPMPDLQSRHLDAAQDTKFPLSIYLTRHSNGLNIVCSYLSTLFTPETIETIITRYIRILEKIAADPTRTNSSYHKSGKKRTFTKKKND